MYLLFPSLQRVREEKQGSRVGKHAAAAVGSQAIHGYLRVISTRLESVDGDVEPLAVAWGLVDVFKAGQKKLPTPSNLTDGECRVTSRILETAT